MQTKKQQIINLWQNVFDDSPEFIRLFFDRVYKEENALTLEREGQLVSMLHMLPYPMTYQGETISVSYIYGACTMESERSKGYMGELLEKSFEIMRARGVALTVLIPAESWLFNYYHRFGYAVCFDYSTETYESDTLPPSCPSVRITASDGNFTDEVCLYLDQKQRQRPCYVLHTKEDWETNQTDLHSSGGEILIARQNDKVCGVAFALPSSETEVTLQEIFYDQESIKEALLQESASFFRAKKIICHTPAKPSLSSPFAMARMIDRTRMIGLWMAQHPQDSPERLQQMDTPSLTQYLLQYKQRTAYMSLMMD